jgi:hypothetical protein
VLTSITHSTKSGNGQWMLFRAITLRVNGFRVEMHEGPSLEPPTRFFLGKIWYQNRSKVTTGSDRFRWKYQYAVDFPLTSDPTVFSNDDQGLQPYE